MMASPTAPSAIFWGLGALTIGSKSAGSGMSGLEAAGDLEGHQTGRLAEVAAGKHDVDPFLLSGALEGLHEVPDRPGRERGPPPPLPEVVATLQPPCPPGLPG